MLLHTQFGIVRSFFLLAAFAFSALPAHAQQEEQWNAMNPYEFVIVYSTKEYPAALRTALDASKRPAAPLDLAGNKPHKIEGLSPSPADCKSGGYEYPCYTPRGFGSASENPRHVSIEWSMAYEGFKPGCYVVVGEGAPNSATLRASLAAAKRRYPGAYAKTTKVWLGCMH